jgi:hypothetical protein
MAYKNIKKSFSNQNGSAKEYNGVYRHFKIIEVNGKAVKYDNSASIKEHQTPLNAAKKLLKSICLQKGLKGMKKLECNVTFIIKETTQGSNKKMFGPYSGKYVKYTPEEAKKATASGISFKMKPVVNLHKNFSHVKSSMKGGSEACDSYAAHKYDGKSCEYNIQKGGSGYTCTRCKKWYMSKPDACTGTKYGKLCLGRTFK